VMRVKGGIDSFRISIAHIAISDSPLLLGMTAE